MPEQELAAQAIVEQARLQGGRRVSGHYEKVRPGQAGRMIVNEARQMRAQAIVVPLPARTGSSVFGKTVETVLAERPCRVIIHSDGAGGDGGSAAPARAGPAGLRRGAPGRGADPRADAAPSPAVLGAGPAAVGRA